MHPERWTRFNSSRRQSMAFSGSSSIRPEHRRLFQDSTAALPSMNPGRGRRSNCYHNRTLALFSSLLGVEMSLDAARKSFPMDRDPSKGMKTESCYERCGARS